MKPAKNRHAAKSSTHIRRRSRTRKQGRKDTKARSNNRQKMSFTNKKLRNIEVKIAIVQFMLNQVVDDLQQQGIYTEQEMKDVYSKTYQFWKNDLQGMGSPFEKLDVTAEPLLQ